jgi:hypothetical protein
MKLFCINLYVLTFVLPTTGLTQETPNKWAHSFAGELYQFEMFKTDSKGAYLTVNYCGQSVRYSLERQLSDRLSIGAETGTFFHTRNGEMRRTFHSYIPLQLVLRLSTKAQRFAMSLSAGYPLMLTKKDPYVGTGGLWYKNVWHNPAIGNDERFFDAQSRIVDKYYLVAALKCHFSISETNKWYINAGIQYYGFSSNVYNGGDYLGSYSAFKYGNCVNLLGGVSYRFGS